jgi:hypothetical protein
MVCSKEQSMIAGGNYPKKRGGKGSKRKMGK